MVSIVGRSKRQCVHALRGINGAAHRWQRGKSPFLLHCSFLCTALSSKHSSHQANEFPNFLATSNNICVDSRQLNLIVSPTYQEPDNFNFFPFAAHAASGYIFIVCYFKKCWKLFALFEMLHGSASNFVWDSGLYQLQELYFSPHMDKNLVIGSVTVCFPFFRCAHFVRINFTMSCDGKQMTIKNLNIFT